MPGTCGNALCPDRLSGRRMYLVRRTGELTGSYTEDQTHGQTQDRVHRSGLALTRPMNRGSILGAVPRISGTVHQRQVTLLSGRHGGGPKLWA